MAAEVDTKELMQATEIKEESRYIKREQLDRIADENWPAEFQKTEGCSDKPPQATESLENAEKKQPDCSIRDTLHLINKSNGEISEGESFFTSPSSAEVVYKTSGMSANSPAGEMTSEAATNNWEPTTNVDVIEELPRKEESDSHKDLNGSELDAKEDHNMPSKLGENVETEMSICSKNDLTQSVMSMNDSPTEVTKDVLGKHKSGLHKVIELEEIPSVGIQRMTESTQQMEVTMPGEDETKNKSDPSNLLVGVTEGQSLHQEGNSDANKIAAEIKSGEVREIKMNNEEADDSIARKVVQVDSTYNEKNDNSAVSLTTQEEKIQSRNENLTGADTSEAQCSSGQYETCTDKERHTEDEACKSTGLVPKHPLTKEEFQKETISNAAEGDKYGAVETEAEASIKIYGKDSQDKRDKCFEGVALQEEPVEMCGGNESNYKDHGISMRLEEKDALSTDRTEASNEENSNMILTDNERREDKCESFTSEPNGGDKLSKETDQTHESAEGSSTYINKQKEIHGECMEKTCFEASIDKQEGQEPCVLLHEESSQDAELNEVKEEDEMETSKHEYRPEESIDDYERMEKLPISSNENLGKSEARTFSKNAYPAEKEKNYNSTEENISYEKGEQVTAIEDVQEKEIKVEKDDDANDNQHKDSQAAELNERCPRETSLPRKEDNLMEPKIKEVQENKENNEGEPYINACHTVEVSNPEIKNEAESSDIVARDNALQANEEQGKPSTIVQIDMKEDDGSNFGNKNDMESSVMDATEGRVDLRMQEVAPDAETEEYKEVDIIGKLSIDTLPENLEETSTLKLQECMDLNAKTNGAVNRTSEKDGSIHQIVDEVPKQEDKLTEAEYVTESELLENATECTKLQESEDLLHTKVNFENESTSAEVSREETRKIVAQTEVYQQDSLSEKLTTLEADIAEEESGDGVKRTATFEATAHVEKDPGSKLEEHDKPEKEGCNTEANAQTTKMFNGDTIASGCHEMIQSSEQIETKNLEAEEDPGKQSESYVAEDGGEDKPTNNLIIAAEESSKTKRGEIFEEAGNCNVMMDIAALTGTTEMTFRKAEVDDMPVTASAKCLDMGRAENTGNEHIQHGEDIEKMEMDKTSPTFTFPNDQIENEEENLTVQYLCDVEAKTKTTSLSVQECDSEVKEADSSDITITVENTKQAGVKDISEASTTSSIQEAETASADARTAEQSEQITSLPQSTLTVPLADEPTNRITNNSEHIEKKCAEGKEMQQNKSLETPFTGAVEGNCMNEKDLKKDGVTSKTLAKEVTKDPPEEEGKGHTNNEVPIMDPQEQTGRTEIQETSLASEENNEESVKTKENPALLEKYGTSTVLSEIRECEVSTTSVCAVVDSTTFEEDLQEQMEEQEKAGDKEEVPEHKSKEAKEVHEISNATSTVTKEAIPGSSSADNAKATSIQEQTTALAAECKEIVPDTSDSHSSAISQETENPDAGMKIIEKTGSCYDENIGATMTAETIENESEVCFEKEESRQHGVSNVEIPPVTESTTDNGGEVESRTTMGSHKAEPQVKEETEICTHSNGFNEATHSDEQIEERNLESTDETAWKIQSNEEKVPEVPTIVAKDAAEDIKREIPSDSDTSHGRTDAKVVELPTRTKEYNQESSDEIRKKINNFDEALAPKEATMAKCYKSPFDIEENAEQPLENPMGKGSKVTENENLNEKSETVDEIKNQCEKASEGHDDTCKERSNEEVDAEHGKHNEIDDMKENKMEEANGTKDIHKTLPANSLVGEGRENGTVPSEFSETTDETCIQKGEPSACTTSEDETKANSSRRDAPHENQNEGNINIEAQPDTHEQEAREMQCADQTAICRENTDPATKREEVLKFQSDNSKAACYEASEFQPHDTPMEAGTDNVETKFLDIDSKPADFEPEKDHEMELAKIDTTGDDAIDTTGDDAIDKEVDAGHGRPDEIANLNEKQKDEADDANKIQEMPTSSTISKERDIKSTSTMYGKVTAEVCINREEQNEHKLPETVTEASQGNYFTAKESEEEANIQNEAPEATPQDVSATKYIEYTDFCQQNMEASKESKKASEIMVEKSESENTSHGSLTEAVPTYAEKDNLNAELEPSCSDLEILSMKPIDGNNCKSDETYNGGEHVAQEKVDQTKNVGEYETEEGKAKDIHVTLPTNSTINKERDNIAEYSETTGETCNEGNPGASERGTENNSDKMDVLDENQDEGKVEDGGPKPQFQEEVREIKCACFPNISKEDAESSTQIEDVSNLALEKCKIKSEVTSKDQSHDSLTGGAKDAEIKNSNEELKSADVEHVQCETEIVKEDISIGEASNKEVNGAFEKASEIEIEEDTVAAAANINETTICKERDILIESRGQSDMTEEKCIKDEESSAFTELKCETEESRDKIAIMKEDQHDSQIEDQVIKEEPQEQELREVRSTVSSPVSQENAQPCTRQDKESDCLSHKSAPECQPHESLKGTPLEDAELKSPNAESESVDIVPAVIATEQKNNKHNETEDGTVDESETTKEHTLDSSGDGIDEAMGNNSPEMERDDIAEQNKTTRETYIEKQPSASECETEDSSNKRDVPDEDQKEGRAEEGSKPHFQEQEVSEMKHADFLNISEEDAESSTQSQKGSDLASEIGKIKFEVASEDQYDILTGGLKDADIKSLNMESKLVGIEHEKQCEIEVKENGSIGEASDKEVHAAFGKVGGIEIKKDTDIAAANIDVATICKERDISPESMEQSEVTEERCIKNQESSAFPTSQCEIEESGDKTTTTIEDQDEERYEDQGMKEEPQEQELSEIRGAVSSQVGQEDAQPCTTLKKESDHVFYESAPECLPRETLKGSLLEDAELKSSNLESKYVDVVPSMIAIEEKSNKGKADESETTKDHKLESSGDVIEEVVDNNSPKVEGNNSLLTQERDNTAEHNETTGETCIQKEPSAIICETEDDSNKRDVLGEDQNKGKAEEEGPKPHFRELEVSDMTRADSPSISKKDAELSTQKEKVSDLASEESKIKSEVTSEDQSHDILTEGKDAEIKNLNVGSKLVDNEPEKQCVIEIVKEDISIGEASDREVHAALEKAGEIEIKKDIDATVTNIDVITICKKRDIFSGSTKQSEVTEQKCEIEEHGDKTVIMREDQDEGKIEAERIKEEPQEQKVSEEIAQTCAMPDRESDCAHRSATEYQPGESPKGTLLEDAELKSPNVESKSVDIVPAVIAAEEKDNKQNDTGDGKADEHENVKVCTIQNSCDVIDEVVGNSSPKVVGNKSVLSQERDIYSASAEFVEEQFVNCGHPMDQKKPNLETEVNGGDNKETINEDEEKRDVQNEIMKPKSLREVTEPKQTNSQKNSQDEEVSKLLAEESETCKVASEVLSYDVITKAESQYSESKHLDVASEVVGERNNITKEETPYEEVSGEPVKCHETDHTKECETKKSSDAIEIHPVLTRETPITKDTSSVIVEQAEALDLGEEKKAGYSKHASTVEILEKEKLHDEQNGISMEPVKTPEEDEKDLKEEAGSSYDHKHAASSTIEATEAFSLETQKDEEHMHMQDPDKKENEFLEAERTDTSLSVMKEEVTVENISLKTIAQHLIQCENTEEVTAAVQSPTEPIHHSEDPSAKAMDIEDRAISEEKLKTERESATTYCEKDITIPQDGKLLIGKKITSETSLIKDLQTDVQSQTLATTMVSDEKECQNIEDGNRVEDTIQGKESLEAPLKLMEEDEEAQEIPIKEEKKKESIPSTVLQLENQEKEKDTKCAFPPSVEQETESDSLTEEASIPILAKITKACETSGNEVSNRQEEEISNKSLPDEAQADIRDQDSETPAGKIIIEAPILKEEVLSAENFQKNASLDHEEENRVAPDRELQVKKSAEVPGGEVPRESPLHKETVVSTDSENVSPNLKDKFPETLEKVEGSKSLTEVNSAVEQGEQGGEAGKQRLSGNAKENPMPADASSTSLSDLLQKSTKDTLQMVKDLAEKKEPEAKLEVQKWETEVIEHEEMRTDEERDELGEDERRETETGQDAPLLAENTKDVDVKVPHKKSHNILSGVGSRVKHSISKVKKVITGKSSHSKAAHSPK